MIFRVEIGYEIISKIANSLFSAHIALWGRELIWGVVIFVLRLVWNQVKGCKESVCWSPFCIMKGCAHFGELWYFIVLRLVWNQVKDCKESLLVPILYYEGESSFWGVAKVAASDVCSTFYDNTPPQREDRFNVKTSL